MLGVLLENSRAIFGGRERRGWDFAFFVCVPPFPWLLCLSLQAFSIFLVVLALKN